MEKYNVSDLIPQKAPMQFITAIESIDFDKQTLVARVDVSDKDLMYDSKLGGVPSWISLEYMAQTIACFIGAEDLQESSNATPSVGFILGSRKLSVNIPMYLVNQSYYIHVSSSFCDKNIANFDCQIYNQEKNLVACGVLNVFRPDDIQQFMEERNE